ncbi:MAG: type III-A CRISPR-associated RAMP protein Csm5 [Archaeoglobaceae archaeon]|nr:type III-A CRISPR-associated RAMP protein Csm5 [Archaeoglobaceae archaeon]MCX8152684.1 type III-A CRISPR-associated RAMP protein Csm5 [Archaeoglobaceae archaeon]
MKLKIKTPTHIGSGSRYEPIDYIYDEDDGDRGKVYIIDYEKVFKEEIFDKEKPDFEKIKEKIKEIGVERFTKYKIDSFCSKPGRILEHIKSAGKPYIPGSSLKGTIRTAIFWKYIMEEKKIDKIEKIASEQGWKKAKKEFDSIEKEFFGENNDFIRFIFVSDSSLANPEDLAVYEIKVLSEQKNKLEKIEKIRIFVEALKPGTELHFDLKIKNYENKYLKSWKRILLEFSKYVVEKVEIPYLKKLNEKNLLTSLESILSDMNKGKILFRIGFSTGWLWKTIGSLLDDKKRVKLAKELKLARRFGSSFPKTRRVIGEHEFPGWVEIVET